MWPAGPVLAAFIALRARARVLIGAGVGSVMTVALGLAGQARGGFSFRVPAIVGLAVAALTQLVYPVLDGSLLGLDPRMLGVLDWAQYAVSGVVGLGDLTADNAHKGGS